MAQTGYTPISLYYTTTAAGVPLAANLVSGELAINITDGKLFYKNAGNVVTLLASSSGATGDVVGPASATDNALVRFDATTGKLIQNSVGILSDAGILTGLTGITSSGTVTFSGLTAGRVIYTTSGGQLTNDANLVYNGTTLTANTLNLTNPLGTTYGGTGLTSFTANGVVYASSSSVLATGSALTFDGTNLGIGTTSPGSALEVKRTSGNSQIAVNYNDTNTGRIVAASNGNFYIGTSVGAGSVVIGNTANADAMTLDNSGSLLVGTTTAAGKVTFAGSGAASQTLTLNGTTTGANFARITSSGADGVIGIESSAGSAIMSGSSANATVLYTVGATSLQFGTNSTTRATIDSSGNLGVGTSSPASGSRLAISGGALNFPETSGRDILWGTSSYVYITGNQGTGVLAMGTGSTERMRLDSSGNLNVGVTSTQGGRLSIVAGASQPYASFDSPTSGYAYTLLRYNNTPYAYFGQASGLIGGASDTNFALRAENALLFATGGGNERARIDSSGNLGIGTSSPTAKLDVRSAIGTSVDSSQNINLIDTTSYALGNGGGVSFGYVFNTGGSVIARAAVVKGIKENATDGNYASALTFSTTANSASTTEKMRLDSSGNLGLGVTPSAWSGFRALQIGGTTSLWSSTSGNSSSFYTNNGYFNGSDRIYLTDGFASEYIQGSGQHIWYTAPFGTASNAINFTQAMTLDASGNLVIGDTSSSSGLSLVRSGSTTAELKLSQTGTGGRDYRIGSTGSGYGSAGNLIFYDATAVAERMRLDASGNLLVGTTTALDPLTVTNGITTNGGGLDFATSGVKNWQVIGNATDFYIGDQTLTRYAALTGITTFTAWTFVSDERLKENIEPLNYGINEVMQLRPTRYKFKNEEQTNIGFIAQEVKQIIPEMVTGSGGDFYEKDTAEQRANKTLGIGKETLIPVLVKAIQEQQALIQSLTDRITQLEAK